MRTALVLVVSLVLTLSSCQKVRPVSGSSSNESPAPGTSGDIEWDTGTATLDLCSGGQAYSFYGVILRSSAEPNVEVRIRRDAIT